MSSIRLPLIATVAATLTVGGWLLIRPKSIPIQPPVSPVVQRQGFLAKRETVAALGQLEPAGDIRSLAAPTAGIAGTPRISVLHVLEGDSIKRGQILATFDNRQGLLADLERLNAKLRRLDQEIILQETEVRRFSQAAELGAAERVLVDNKREELIRMQGQRSQTLAERKGLMSDLALSQLTSPIDGLVLDIHAREGERPSSSGVMDVGASQQMEARIEVYESDISNIRLGQTVQLISENGGFEGNLEGRVIRISPRVEQRAVMSTDPTGDVDARVVEVDVALNADDAEKVTRLAGLKVIARFQSKS
ncbi:HlyD family efflux transporter periplasmic adaptor subunit [Synechococcus sp. M16CYN]|uniref:HlyD family efflux transporter periplasmic adaptor subunit n=1 Tax=Synechococcus sp. M16CYN TaxID=3103139 RepID=UPI003245CEF8